MNRSFETQGLHTQIIFLLRIHAFIHKTTQTYFTHPHLDTQKLSRADVFTHRSIYTQKTLTRKLYTHRCFHTRKFAGAHASTRRNFYTIDALTHRSYPRRLSQTTFTQRRLHAKVFARSSFYTEAVDHRCFHAQTPLRTQVVLHTECFHHHLHKKTLKKKLLSCSKVQKFIFAIFQFASTSLGPVI